MDDISFQIFFTYLFLSTDGVQGDFTMSSGSGNNTTGGRDSSIESFVHRPWRPGGVGCWSCFVLNTLSFISEFPASGPYRHGSALLHLERMKEREIGLLLVVF